MICDTYILFPPTASSFLDENAMIYIAALCAVIGVITVLLVIISCCLCVLRRKSRSMISYMEYFCCEFYVTILFVCRKDEFPVI